MGLGLPKDHIFDVQVKEIKSGGIFKYAVSRKVVDGKEIPHVSLKNAEIVDIDVPSRSSTEVFNGVAMIAEEGQQLPSLASSTSFEESEILVNTLKHFFAYDDFRPLQREAITAGMNGENVLTVLSTGGGKSLLYMLPSVLASRPTLVVCPIKSLIADQIIRCEQAGITACQFTGDVPDITQAVQLQNLEKMKLIFSTPELLEEGPFSQKITSLAQERRLESIVFD